MPVIGLQDVFDLFKAVRITKSLHNSWIRCLTSIVLLVRKRRRCQRPEGDCFSWKPTKTELDTTSRQMGFRHVWSCLGLSVSLCVCGCRISSRHQSSRHMCRCRCRPTLRRSISDPVSSLMTNIQFRQNSCLLFTFPTMIMFVFFVVGRVMNKSTL